MKVVLFCGGLGMRMREGGSAVPKPMALLGERPLLWHVMRYYAHFGHTDFVLCLGYGANVVKDYFLHYDETLSNDFTLSGGAGDVRLFSSDITDWNITFINTGHQSTIGERLMRVRAHVENEPMFLCNYADTLTDAPLPDLIDKFAESDRTVSMLAVPPFSTHHYLDIDDDGQVTGIRGFNELTQWENGGYFVMRPDIFDELREGEDIVPHALDRLHPKGRLMAQRYKGFWRAVDTFKDRAEMEELVNRGLAPWMLWTNPALVG
ncbi:glucose-1-phosphate cytidylyltransferase [Hamadaea flava]|uniref:Glucose-1-phosphate cytidylyltransferase n=1 Tax=Hamadaea flava TaxID=1742688 RepID=A0ABV8LKE7_9ACTN|nr:glucose-1-phosphate cytidylyltransferase [Hamadaea flava]MCP2325090.1 glucose-1-phosphate cytidylyltransferase [Hamadaea flava]